MRKFGLRILHKLSGHRWAANSNKEFDGWDTSEPTNVSGGDYLPTKWKAYTCNCGLNKRTYFDGFTHFGVMPPRDFVGMKNE